ncbi:MAG: carboxypeptidase-like regulatory domain-containing protein [Cyclobacteriaceae bacterium]
MKKFLLIRWFVFFFVLSSSAFCQQLVEGTIVDKETGKPIPFASIGVVGTSKGTSSNQNGQFSISVIEPISLKVTCIGYESLLINSLSEMAFIELKPIITQLSEIVILDKPANARKILRKAFANIDENYSDQPFLQKFFYRHYCKDDNAYGRLIEASVDVWKNQGYRSVQKVAGEKEEIRVTQLRRSLDKTEMAQGHEPISIGNILQADVVAYQTATKNNHLSFYTDVSNIKTDFERYDFTCTAITYYDGLEVYQINYSHKKDSVLTTAGNYLALTQVTGSLFVTTDTYAFVKTEEEKTFGNNTIRTLAYYRKYADRYYPYHFIREGESHTSENNSHSFHIELMSVEVKNNMQEKFVGRLSNREELLNIPYDSAFWTSSTVLKTTPLEDKIIGDLGGGTSLNKQFYRYRQYEINLRDGGKNGEEKFNWLCEDSKGNRILYLVFWSGSVQSYLVETELAKRLNKKYRNKITFVFLSLDDDENQWQQAVQKFSLYTDGIINYRIGSNSKTAKVFGVKEMPAFVLVGRSGEVFDLNAKHPSNPLLEKDFKFLIEKR